MTAIEANLGAGAPPSWPERTPLITAGLASAAEALAQSTVAVRADRGSGGGSGIIWTSDGTIVTNAHVARGARALIETVDGRVLDGRVTRRDEGRDLAVIQVEARDLPAAVTGDSSQLRTGELVIAVGHPLGVPGAIALGVVHSVGHRPPGLPGAGPRWVQADIRLAPGNSGGPLGDAHGHVVGVNSMIVGGLGLAVPSRAVDRFLGAADERPWLGITMRPAIVRGRAGAQLGLAVVHVDDGGSAADAGVLLGDVIVSAGGAALGNPGALAALVADADIGERVTLGIVRAGRAHDREVTLRVRPARSPAGIAAA